MKLLIDLPPLLGDEMLQRLCEDALSARSQAEFNGYRAPLGRIDAVLESVEATLATVAKGFLAAMEGQPEAKALYQEMAAITSAIAEAERAGQSVRLAVLQRSAERVNGSWHAQLLPLQRRLRDAFGIEIADAKAQLKVLLMRQPALLLHRSLPHPATRPATAA